MFKNYLILLLAVFLLFACSKKNKVEILEPEINEDEMVIDLYKEAVEALEKGDAFYAAKKFKEVETLMPLSTWAAKASLMAAYADYTRNAYEQSVFSLERHLKNYPGDKNTPYAHYLIAICYYEQILDEKKDLDPLLKAQKKFEFIVSNYPDTDYSVDALYKLDLIIDQLAAKEISIARFYMQTEKWIPALNRLKLIVEKYDKTVFIEEALHRLVEVNYKIGLESEAREAAAILGYNYQSSEWYEKSYKVFNKKYKIKKVKKEKEMGFLRKKIKGLFE
jgi:outer membrane protein assembly factor BamD|tara:strand:+ start:804 stop:1637 length:834 start_codon:yes stop_codon:yes gene_type:complete